MLTTGSSRRPRVGATRRTASASPG
jgi:hypothetical protein